MLQYRSQLHVSRRGSSKPLRQWSRCKPARQVPPSGEEAQLLVWGPLPSGGSREDSVGDSSGGALIRAWPSRPDLLPGVAVGGARDDPGCSAVFASRVLSGSLPPSVISPCFCANKGAEGNTGAPRPHSPRPSITSFPGSQLPQTPGCLPTCS